MDQLYGPCEGGLILFGSSCLCVYAPYVCLCGLQVITGVINAAGCREMENTQEWTVRLAFLYLSLDSLNGTYSVVSIQKNSAFLCYIIIIIINVHLFKEI